MGTQKEDALGPKNKQKLNISSEIRDRNSTKNVGKNNLLPPGGSEKKGSDSSESETDALKTVASFKSKRTCAGCGRVMANESVLAYHMIRCTGDLDKTQSEYQKKDLKNKQNDIDKLGD